MDKENDDDDEVVARGNFCADKNADEEEGLVTNPWTGVAANSIAVTNRACAKAILGKAVFIMVVQNTEEDTVVVGV